MLPSQFLIESSELTDTTGAHVRHRLISPRNKPATDVEKKGLEEVSTNPEKAATSTATIGNQRYFQAIYLSRSRCQSGVYQLPQRAPRSPKEDFLIRDVMGGLVIEIPLGR